MYVVFDEFNPFDPKKTKKKIGVDVVFDIINLDENQ